MEQPAHRRLEFSDHFSERAALYASARPAYPAEFADALAELAPRHELAWDVGCGSGQMSRLLAARFTRVVATDASSEQLAHALAQANVEYRREPAEHTTLEGGSVDLIVAAQSVHWFELAGFYAEVRRVARPGALLALVCYSTMRVDAQLASLVEDFYGGTLARHWPEERAHVESNYRELPFPFDEFAPSARLRAASQMHASWTVDQVLDYIGTWSAVRALERQGGRADLERFATRLREAWGPAHARRTLRWPLAVRLARLGGAAQPSAQ